MAKTTQIEPEMFKLLNYMSQYMRGKPDDFLALAKYKEMPKLTKPTDYHEKIEIIQGYYLKDPLFSMLVDQTIKFAVDGHDWELISPDDEKLTIGELMDSFKNNKVRSEKEENIWRKWDRKLNIELGNVLPGTGIVDEWIAKKTWLTGMCALTWKYGTIPSGDDRSYDYKMPTIMVNWPSESVRLQKGINWADPEEFWRKIPETDKQKKLTEKNDIPKADTSETADLKKQYEKMSSMSDGKDIASFVVKMNWSPGDVAIEDKSSDFDLCRGLYPNPPFEDCIPWLMIREALCSSDLQILDGLINIILLWRMGDKEYNNGELRPARKDKSGTTIKGDFDYAKLLLETYGAKKVMDMYLPWWITPEFIAPPTETLLNKDKYLQATFQMLAKFGIILSAEGNVSDFNTLFYEQNIKHFRNKILLPFWDMLCGNIVERNTGRLTTIPNRRYNPLPFSRDKIIESIQKGHEQGEVSTETYLRMIDIDPNVERARVRREVGRGDRDIYDKAVPTRFKQDVVKGGEKTTLTTSEGVGRPKGKKDSEKREPAKE